MIRKTLIYISFTIFCLTEAALFASASSYQQLVVATITYPLLALIAIKLMPKKKQNPNSVVGQAHTTIETLMDPAQTSDSIDESPRRDFLQLIGAAGLSFLVYSLLNRRGESLFVGSSSKGDSSAIRDNKGKVINPAELQPLDGYQVSDIDSNNVETTYIGFTRVDGGWFIMKQDNATGAFRYVKGEEDFANNWSSRDALGYDYYYNVFEQ